MRFSVIIPLYNKAAYIANTIKSVWQQSFKDFELIVIDDASTDDSARIVKVLQQSHPDSSLRFIQQDNTGVSIARNNAVKASNGEYLCFLDADDWWEPNFLLNLNELILNFPSAGVYGTNYFYVKNAKRKVKQNIKTGYINYFKEYADSLAMPLCIGSTAIPRSVFDEMGGFNSKLKLGEDFNLWVKISIKYKIAFLNIPLFNYNQDVEIKNRATRNLQNPQNHMLWNLQEFEKLEKENADFKELIDKIRANSLMPYYLDPKYHDKAVIELKKVAWTTDILPLKKEYSKPLPWLKFKSEFLHVASILKTILLRKFSNIC